MSTIIILKIYIVFVFICTIVGSFWVGKKRYSKGADYIFGSLFGMVVGFLMPLIGFGLVFALKFLFTA